MRSIEQFIGQRRDILEPRTMVEFDSVFDSFEPVTEPGAYFRNGAKRNGRSGGVVVAFSAIERIGNHNIFSKEFAERHPNASTFDSREARSRGRFSIGRAWSAFTAYLQHRDYFDLQTLRERSRIECMKGDRSSCDVRNIIKGFEPRGGERIIGCGSLEEAAGRVIELVGPVVFSRRAYDQNPLEVERRLRELGVESKGFSTADGIDMQGQEMRRQVTWRLDWDEEKGCHFNAIFRPSGKNGNGNVYYGNCDPRTLNIAFGFPGDESCYYEFAQMVEMQRIEDMIKLGRGEPVSAISYLSFTRGSQA